MKKNENKTNNENGEFNWSDMSFEAEIELGPSSDAVDRYMANVMANTTAPTGFGKGKKKEKGFYPRM